MKLAEFLNDDTCQIFLAIIVGIVVCYFIFGSCSTCKDGFSVGGQNCIGTIEDRPGTRPFQDGTPGGTRNCTAIRDKSACESGLAEGCVWMDEPPTDDQCSRAMSVITERCCDEPDEDCREGYPTTCNSDCAEVYVPFYDHCRQRPPFSNTDSRVQGYLDNTYTLCSRGQDAATSGPPPPPPLTRNQNIKNDMKQFLLQIIKEGEQFYDRLTGPREPTFENYNSIARSKGIYFMILINNQTESSFDNKIFMDTKSSGDGGYQHIVTLGTDGSSENDDITTKNFNCNTRNQLYQSPIINSDGRELTTYNQETGKLNVTVGGTRFATINTVDDDIQDIIQQVNNICTGGGNRNVNNDGNIESIYLPNSDCKLRCSDGTTPWSPTCVPMCSKDTNKKFKLGDYFRTVSALNDEQLKTIYCEPNGMTIGTEEKYDPLLKVKTKELIDNNFCSGIWKNTDGNDCTGPDCDYAYEEDLTGENDISDELRRRELTTNAVGNSNNTPLSEDYKNVKSSILNKNKYEMIVDSKFTMLERAILSNNPKYIDIKVDKNINTEINDGNTTRFTLSRNNYYRLLKAYGLSQDYSGNIYNTAVEGDIDAATMNLPSQNSYLYNLHRLQYLIAKILLGTGRYYDDNINIYKNIPAHPNPGPLASRTLNTTNYTTPDGDDLPNTQCGDSERDYLLLVFKDYGNSVSSLSEDNIPDCSTNSVSFNDAYNTGILSDGNICRLPQ